MRYELDSEGYICKVFFGCHSGTCTLYEGEVPVGYETLEEWATTANVQAYKVVSGDLIYDTNRAAQLEIKRSNLEKGLLWSGVCSVGKTVELLENIKNYKTVHIRAGDNLTYLVCPIMPTTTTVRGVGAYAGTSSIEVIGVRATCASTSFKLDSIQQFKIATSGISNVEISTITEIWGVI